MNNHQFFSKIIFYSINTFIYSTFKPPKVHDGQKNSKHFYVCGTELKHMLGKHCTIGFPLQHKTTFYYLEYITYNSVISHNTLMSAYVPYILDKCRLHPKYFLGILCEKEKTLSFFKIKKSLLGANEMAHLYSCRCLSTNLTTCIRSQGPTRQKKKANFHKLSSNCTTPIPMHK